MADLKIIVISTVVEKSLNHVTEKLNLMNWVSVGATPTDSVKLANIYGVSIEEIAGLTTENSKKIFGI